MQYFIVYYDAADIALNQVGPFTDFDKALEAAIAKQGMPADAVLPSEVMPAADVPAGLSGLTIQ